MKWKKEHPKTTTTSNRWRFRWKNYRSICITFSNFLKFKFINFVNTLSNACLLWRKAVGLNGKEKRNERNKQTTKATTTTTTTSPTTQQQQQRRRWQNERKKNHVHTQKKRFNIFLWRALERCGWMFVCVCFRHYHSALILLLVVGESGGGGWYRCSVWFAVQFIWHFKHP